MRVDASAVGTRRPRTRRQRQPCKASAQLPAPSLVGGGSSRGGTKPQRHDHNALRMCRPPKRVPMRAPRPGRGHQIIHARAPASRAQRGALRRLAAPRTRVAAKMGGLTYILHIQSPPTQRRKQQTTTRTVSRRAYGCHCRWNTSPPNAQARAALQGQRTAASAITGGRGQL